MLLDIAAEFHVQPAAEVRVRLIEPLFGDPIEAHVPPRQVDRELDPRRRIEGAQVELLPALHLLDVVALELRALKLRRVQHALARQEHLGRVHGLDQVVRDVAPDRLVHERFLLALRDEDDRDG